MTRRSRASAVLLILIVACVGEAHAHRDDYLNETLVYLTLERRELEAEYWLDYGQPSSGPGDFFRHNVALEWGITDHWMVDGRGTLISNEGQATKLDSARVETRYRFLEEGARPIDVAFSFEVNGERDPDGSTELGVEPRLVLSRDFHEKLNLTLNLSEEIPLDSGSSAFLAAFGARFNWTERVRVGSELQYDFGMHSGAVIPQVWLAYPKGITVKLGYARGVDRAESDFVRAALEVEF